MFTRRCHRFVARLALAALLFAQVILVAEACLLPAPTMPFIVDTAGQHPGPTSASAYTCEQSQSIDANACLANFTRDDQAASTFTQLTVDALPVVIITLAPRDDRPMRVAARQLTNSSPTEPPPSLRFCSLQL